MINMESHKKGILNEKKKEKCCMLYNEEKVMPSKRRGVGWWNQRLQYSCLLFIGTNREWQSVMKGQLTNCSL